MIYYIITTLILFAICKGVSDGLAHDEGKSGWWSDHWKNKYRRDDKYSMILKPYYSRWYYLGLYTPNFKERFPFSTTILSLTTDAWHFFNFIRYRIVYSYVAIILDLNIWWSLAIVFIFAPILVGVVFELIYKKVK